MKDEDNEAMVDRRFEISRRHRLLQLASCQLSGGNSFSNWGRILVLEIRTNPTRDVFH